MKQPIDIFFSYAHEDERWMHAVRQQLVLFDRQKRINKWYDRMLIPGENWKDKIDHHIHNAGIVLLFVSPDFFDSNYCYEVELKQALKQHKEGKTVVIPIIVRPCPWENAPFAKLQALPTDGQPISKWNDQDEATLNVANGIMKLVEKLEKNRATHL
jgi:hypothetical protein